jgi:hypothetical protein
MRQHQYISVTAYIRIKVWELDEPPSTKHRPEGKKETKRHNNSQLAHTGLARANAALQGASHSHSNSSIATQPKYHDMTRQVDAPKQLSKQTRRLGMKSLNISCRSQQPLYAPTDPN